MRSEREWTELKKSDDYSISWDNSYESLIQSTGCKVIESELTGDYQGDAVALVRDGEDWGFVSWGYGSCSGCDALQACDSINDLNDLRQRLHSGIHWESDPFRLIDWLLGRDWEGQWYGSQWTFINKAIATLSHQHRFSETTIALLSNPECLPEIAADSAQEDGYERVAMGLRDQHSKWSVKSTVLKELHRLGIVSEEVVNGTATT